MTLCRAPNCTLPAVAVPAFDPDYPDQRSQFAIYDGYCRWCWPGSNSQNDRRNYVDAVRGILCAYCSKATDDTCSPHNGWPAVHERCLP